MSNMNITRSAGVLLHPTSLPSHHGVGDLGPSAIAYLDWLAKAGVSWWQVLPLNPAGPGFSPYSATSTFANNELLLSPELLVENGLLDSADLNDRPTLPEYTIQWDRVVPWKKTILERAYRRSRSQTPARLSSELEQLRQQHHWWLEDFALFRAIKTAHNGAPWHEWPAALARREPATLAAWRAAHEAEIELVELGQLLFLSQWQRVHDHAQELGIRILGDLPIFVAYDSADVWAHPELFLLDEKRRRTVVAGVPPDYFSKTGQLWGNPLYDWQQLAEDGYGWWIDRVRHALFMVDAVRLDHFRGFAAHWEVSAADDVATNGRWVPGPGKKLFDAIRDKLGDLPFFAEDLGHITESTLR